jgi:hypothetical protein
MKMTNKLATTLMNCLTMVAISANGCLPQTEEDIHLTEEWARNKFTSILEEWEETMEEKWEIEMTDKPVEIFTN